MMKKRKKKEQKRKQKVIEIARQVGFCKSTKLEIKVTVSTQQQLPSNVNNNDELELQSIHDLLRQEKYQQAELECEIQLSKKNLSLSRQAELLLLLANSQSKIAEAEFIKSHVNLKPKKTNSKNTKDSGAYKLLEKKYQASFREAIRLIKLIQVSNPDSSWEIKRKFAESDARGLLEKHSKEVIKNDLVDKSELFSPTELPILVPEIAKTKECISELLLVKHIVDIIPNSFKHEIVNRIAKMLIGEKYYSFLTGSSILHPDWNDCDFIIDGSLTELYNKIHKLDPKATLHDMPKPHIRFELAEPGQNKLIKFNIRQFAPIDATKKLSTPDELVRNDATKCDVTSCAIYFGLKDKVLYDCVNGFEDYQAKIFRIIGPSARVLEAGRAARFIAKKTLADFKKSQFEIAEDIIEQLQLHPTCLFAGLHRRHARNYFIEYFFTGKAVYAYKNLAVTNQLGNVFYGKNQLKDEYLKMFLTCSPKLCAMIDERVKMGKGYSFVFFLSCLLWPTLSQIIANDLDYTTNPVIAIKRSIDLVICEQEKLIYLTDENKKYLCGIWTSYLNLPVESECQDVNYFKELCELRIKFDKAMKETFQSSIASFCPEEPVSKTNNLSPTKNNKIVFFSSQQKSQPIKAATLTTKSIAKK